MKVRHISDDNGDRCLIVLETELELRAVENALECYLHESLCDPFIEIISALKDKL